MVCVLWIGLHCLHDVSARERERDKWPNSRFCRPVTSGEGRTRSNQKQKRKASRAHKALLSLSVNVSLVPFCFLLPGKNLYDTAHGTPRDPASIKTLKVPSVQKTADMQTEARQKRLYAHAHTYHINSISVNRYRRNGRKKERRRSESRGSKPVVVIQMRKAGHLTLARYSKCCFEFW